MMVFCIAEAERCQVGLCMAYVGDGGVNGGNDDGSMRRVYFNSHEF